MRCCHKVTRTWGAVHVPSTTVHWRTHQLSQFGGALPGIAYNMNDAGLFFELTGQYDVHEPLVLDLGTYKYLDTSEIEADVQPKHIRVTFKEKVFQLALPEEVKPDSSKCARSKMTGHMMITMPKLDQVVRPKTNAKKHPEPVPLLKSNELLDGDGTAVPRVDYSKIMQVRARLLSALGLRSIAIARPTSSRRDRGPHRTAPLAPLPCLAGTNLVPCTLMHLSAPPFSAGGAGCPRRENQPPQDQRTDPRQRRRLCR